MKHKTINILSIISILLIVPLSGQDFYYGVIGGMNIADMNITGDGEEQDVDPLNLWGLGGVFGVKMNENISFQLRPMYLKKGGTLIQEDSPEIDFQMSFIEFDCLAKVSAGDKLKPYLIAGPSIGILLNAEIESDVEGNSFSADITDISKKVELSLNVGAGFDIPLAFGNFFIDGRYVFGLNNLNKGGTVELEVDGVVVETNDISEDDEYKNNGFQILAGITFPLTKK